MPSFKNIFLAVTISLLSIPSGAAFPFFSEVFPNTEDDANLEYFSISNASCVPVSLSGYSASDAAGKTFTFDSEAILPPLGFFSVPRIRSKIFLNNEDETLRLFDPVSILVDEFSYSSSSKGVPLFREGISLPVCGVSDSTGSGSFEEGNVEGADVGEIGIEGDFKESEGNSDTPVLLENTNGMEGDSEWSVTEGVAEEAAQDVAENPDEDS